MTPPAVPVGNTEIGQGSYTDPIDGGPRTVTLRDERNIDDE